MHTTLQAPKYIKQILPDIKEKVENTVTLGDFKSLLRAMNRSSTRKQWTWYIRPNGPNRNF